MLQGLRILMVSSVLVFGSLPVAAEPVDYGLGWMDTFRWVLEEIQSGIDGAVEYLKTAGATLDPNGDKSDLGGEISPSGLRGVKAASRTSAEPLPQGFPPVFVPGGFDGGDDGGPPQDEFPPGWVPGG